MMNVCHQCGKYRADKTIDPEGPFAICPECDYRHPFLRLPLFLITGASGTGKTAVLNRLSSKMNEFILLDSDILWHSEFDHPEDHYKNYMETWLRMCKNISQSGKPVMLFGAGTGVPENIEPCIERRYFSQVYYLALICDDDELARRLLERPHWRNCHEDKFIEAQVNFNHWFKSYDNDREPVKIDFLDTTRENADETARKVAAWSTELCIQYKNKSL